MRKTPVSGQPLASLGAVRAGIECPMVLTTQPMDERKAMTHLAGAVRRCDTLRHMIRLLHSGR